MHHGLSALAVDVAGLGLGVVCAGRSRDELRAGFRALAVWLDDYPGAREVVSAHAEANVSQAAAIDNWDKALSGLLGGERPSVDRLEAGR